MEEYKTPEELWNKLQLTNESLWKDWKKRFVLKEGEKLVYMINSETYLNSRLTRAFKKFLIVDGKFNKEKWIKFFIYFSPIIHYDKPLLIEMETVGWTIKEICDSISLNSFLGPIEDGKGLLQGLLPGSHCYRFSSTPGCFVMELVTSGIYKDIIALKFVPVKGQHALKIDKIDKIEKTWKNLIEIEHDAETWKAYSSSFIDTLFVEKCLDSNEQKLFEFLVNAKASSLFNPLIYFLTEHPEREESINGFRDSKLEIAKRSEFHKNLEELDAIMSKPIEPEGERKKVNKAKKPRIQPKQFSKFKEKIIV